MNRGGKALKVNRRSDNKPCSQEAASSPSRPALDQPTNRTDEIVTLNREIDRIDRELLSLKEPLTLPAELSEPLRIPTRGGWFADTALKDEMAERKALQEAYKAEKRARLKRTQQLRERKNVLNRHLNELLSASGNRSVNVGEPIKRKPASAKHEKTNTITIAQKLDNPSQYPTMDVQETCQALGNISRSTAYRWADEGMLQRANLGKKSGKRSRALFTTESVKKMLEDSPE